jgi:hypothetical protein
MSEQNDRRDWQRLYAAAMLESDTTQLLRRIEKAKESIQARLRQLPQISSLRSEEAELHSALMYLRRLDADQ